MKKSREYINNLKKGKEREHLSYEDQPLNDLNDDEPLPEHATKHFFKVFLIIFISVVLVVIWANIDKLTPDNISHWVEYDLLGKTEGEGYPASFSGADVDTDNFDLMDGAPVYCTDTSVAVLNPNAGKYQSFNHAYANPALSTNSNYSIIYNIGATGYTVINRNSVVRSDSTGNNIFCGDICPNGIYCLLTDNENYLGKLTVYRADGLEMYTYSFADFYVNRVSVNREGDHAVVSGLTAKNGGLLSAIYVLDFSQSSYMRKYEFDDVYIYDLKYLDNGNAVAVGDKCAYYIDIVKGSKKDIDYHSRFITGYDLSRQNGMIISLSATPDGRECDILMVDTEGDALSGIFTKRKIISSDYSNGNTTVLFDDGELAIYNSKGTKLSSAELSTDARKVKIADKRIYVLGKSSIYCITQDNNGELHTERKNSDKNK